jgi:hypothetical protein
VNVLPESVLHSAPFLVLATFVAVNTMIYAVLAVAKLAPKVYVTDLVRRRDQRRDNRSIYPDPAQLGPAAPAASPGEEWVDRATEIRAS